MASSNKLRLEVLGGFRRLMKVRATVFKGDEYAMSASRTELREQFKMNREVTDQTHIKELIKGIVEAEELLTHNIVQGRKNERGNYECTISKEAAQTLGGGDGKGVLQPASIAIQSAERKKSKNISNNNSNIDDAEEDDECCTFGKEPSRSAKIEVSKYEANKS